MGQSDQEPEVDPLLDLFDPPGASSSELFSRAVAIMRGKCELPKHMDSPANHGATGLTWLFKTTWTT
jgi:hypothetical protein